VIIILSLTTLEKKHITKPTTLYCLFYKALVKQPKQTVFIPRYAPPALVRSTSLICVMVTVWFGRS